MIYRNTSVGVLIAKMYRDLNLEDPNWENDAIEWSGEALEYIGSFPQLDKKAEVGEVTSHSYALPIELVQIEQILYAYADEATVDNFIDQPKYALPRSESTAHHGTHNELAGERPILWEESYQLIPNYIKTTFEEGIIGISYLAMPIDSFGYPLIPDDVSFREAITWYILRQMIMGGYKHIDVNINYMFADQRWQYYCGQARNKANMMDLDGLETFSQNWVRLVTRRDRNWALYREQVINLPSGVIYGNEHIDISVP